MKTFLAKLIGLWLNGLAWISPATAGRKGFDFFCSPFGSRLKPHQQTFLNSAEQTQLHVNSEIIQVYRWGTGNRKVLFLHGWQSHSFRWKNYISALPLTDYTVYALDAPAHGQSGGKRLHLPKYAQVIQVFLQEIGEVEVIVGHSLGSFATLFALHQNPALPVNRIAITGTPGEVQEFMDFYKQTLSLNQRAMRAILRHFVTIVNHPPNYFSAPRFAESLRIPGLIIHDEHDEGAPYAHAIKIKQAWPQATLLTTRSLGHNLRSTQVVTAITEFIAQGTPTRIPDNFSKDSEKLAAVDSNQPE
jgi:pimeloyl-ACP methyl ester carboxylesterase